MIPERASEPARRIRVHLVCGYNGAGKTTLARELERALPAVRFTLDALMLRLHPELRFDSPGYADRADACRELCWELAQQVLATGVPVVLDWNLWSRQHRAHCQVRLRSPEATGRSLEPSATS